MLRKILSFFFALFMFLPTAHSAEMVNVEYIHQYLNARWGIDLPYNPELKNPKVAANMEYLLTVVDIANEYLNGEKTTSYGTGEYATKLAADTIATNNAIDTLVRGPFTMTTTPDTTSYSMTIGAAGTFVIDWGDGEIETIRNKPLGNTVYSHTYDAPGEYDITLGGRATDYAIIDPDASEIPTLTFVWADLMGGEPPTNLAKISGRLGRVFPTLENGKNPNFYSAFSGAPITEIPAELFDGVHGAPVLGMFGATFAGAQITSVPANLFGELNGNGAPYMFASTFDGCDQLQTVEGPLFSGTITPAERMFDRTFYNSDLTSIPANLFGELNGNGAPNMFEKTFYRCGQLQTAEGPLFSGAITPAESMFSNTFYESGLTSIPANLFGELNGNGAPNMFEKTFYRCGQLQTAEGPLFSGTITPAERMFYGTFQNTQITSVPANLFGELNGDGAPNMFDSTFYGCDQLQTIEGPLFSGTITPAARMFSQMFDNSGLTNIPADLFADVQGAPAEYMFISTFRGTQITSVPANLFGELNGDGAPYMFDSTFYGCDQLQTIEGPLFSGTITPAARMFSQMFDNSGLTNIPADLFADVQGAPAEYMFISTFRGTQITSVPANLFGELNGDGAPNMFQSTFENCEQLQTIEGPLFSGTITPAKSMFSSTFSGSGLTNIPADLFAGVQGAPARLMFAGTFYGSGLTSIPADLFAGVQGAPAESMFSSTFYNTNITSIPENLFAGISGPAAASMFNSTFAYCTSLTGPSARIDGQYLYEIWPVVSNNMGTYRGATGLSDYAQIPDNWK